MICKSIPFGQAVFLDMIGTPRQMRRHESSAEKMNKKNRNTVDCRAS